MARAALGLRAHSGWATLVVLAGPPTAPAVVECGRVELADAAIPGSLQPYHAASGLPVGEAEAFVARCATAAREIGERALREAIGRARGKGHEVRTAGILLASARPPPPLTAALAFHPLMHAADGDLFRTALVHACEGCGTPILKVHERGLLERAGRDLGLPPEGLMRRATALGEPFGPPWRRDEKLATLVAWVAQAGAAAAGAVGAAGPVERA